MLKEDASRSTWRIKEGRNRTCVADLTEEIHSLKELVLQKYRLRHTEEDIAKQCPLVKMMEKKIPNDRVNVVHENTWCH